MGEKKESKIIKEGMIGFFDILGYGSLLENNEPEEIYKEIYPFFSYLLEFEFLENLKIVEKRDGELIDIKEKFKDQKDAIELKVIADTILITLDSSQFSQIKKSLCWTIFLPACSRLQIEMFNKGLPLRGVINYGKYLLEKDFFAGKPIIEAYQISKELELAACVFTTKAIKQFNKDKEILKTNGLKLIIPFFINYLIPQKKTMQYMDTLRALLTNVEKQEIESEVKKTFGSHYKEIKNSTINKLHNTVKWLNELKDFEENLLGAQKNT